MLEYLKCVYIYINITHTHIGMKVSGKCITTNFIMNKNGCALILYLYHSSKLY